MAAERSCEQLDDVNNKLSCEVAPEVIGASSASAIALQSIRIKIAEATARKAHSLIYKVHKPLRDVNEQAYAPQILSIGPYHHGKENLKLMEEHKLRYLQQVILRRPDADVADYIAAVVQIEEAARECYAESLSHITSADFIEMLVLDGCFIIELLLKDEGRTLAADNDPIFQTLWIQNSLKRDMMLLENQIPFFVLCKLFDLIEAPNQRLRLINLAQHFFWPLCLGSEAYAFTETVILTRKSSLVKRKKMRNELYRHRSWDDVKHILDLLHSCWSPPPSGMYELRNANVELRDLGDAVTMLDDEYDDVDLIPEGTRIIKSATELRNANVEFRVLRDSVTMFDVDYRNGALSIPPITIEDSTECILRNLIAYEQYFPDHRSTPFTDYAVLLDCLVNTQADAILLSKIGIFKNKLEDNEAVAKIFNRIMHSVTLRQPFLYENTFTRIYVHSRKFSSHLHDKKNRAIAKLKQDYFSMALLLLLLTIAQTVFSAMQLP